MTMHAEGKGPTGTKLAAWFNKVLLGGLSKLIKGINGIQVIARTDGGVTITTASPILQWFWLMNDHNLESGVTAIAQFRKGLCVNAGHRSDELGSAQFYPPPAFPDPVDEDRPLANIHFTFAKGWFPVGSVVLCANSTGRWEVINDGAHSVEGVVNSVSGSNVVITLTGDVPSTSTLILYGTKSTVFAKDLWNYQPDVGDNVGARFSDAAGQFFIDAKECPA